MVYFSFMVCVCLCFFLFCFFFLFLFFFFFSSRRRHTRWTGDWSSDVCSSDLSYIGPTPLTDRWSYDRERMPSSPPSLRGSRPSTPVSGNDAFEAAFSRRSEERRVGKECRSGWSRDH